MMKRTLEESSAADDTPRPDSKRSKSEELSIVDLTSTNLNPKHGIAEAGPSNTAQQFSKKKLKVGRRRRGTRNDAASQGKEPLDQPKAPRLPKRQSALLIGFCGSAYRGMQIQPDHLKTVEGVLFQAMVRAGAVSQDNADDPVKIGLARAARTDAGVHAAGNLVSLKMITAVPGVPDIAARINEELPEDIRLWGFVRVQNSFNARLACDSRKYTYYFPTYLLLPPKPGSGLDCAHQQHKSSLSLDTEPLWEDSTLSFWKGAQDLPRNEELACKRAWRVPFPVIERLRRTARKYEGTHNYHNFTVSRDFSDRSSYRHIKSIDVSDPVVHGETEWISALFHGQSFMLHQIRKMMSGLVLSCRTNTPPEVIDELYGPKDVFIPKMPSLGLLLEEPIFDSYNSRMADINEKLDPSSPDYRPPIDFEAHREVIDVFRQKYIYSNMRNIEDCWGLFDAWMRSVDAYSGNDLLYLNPKGIIPDVAAIKKGERRENPFKEKKRFDATSFTLGKNKTSFSDNEEKEDGDEDEDEDEEGKWSKQDLAETEG